MAPEHFTHVTSDDRLRVLAPHLILGSVGSFHGKYTELGLAEDARLSSECGGDLPDEFGEGSVGAAQRS
jgi:hypothetical protein